MEAAAQWPARAAEEAVAVAHWLASMRQELVATPAPAAELPKLAALFGPAGLAELLGVTPGALDRYLGGAQAVPDDVAHDAHLIAQVAGALAGSYNDRGIRNWFARPRAELDGRSPRQVFSLPTPDERAAGAVLALAVAASG